MDKCSSPTVGGVINEWFENASIALSKDRAILIIRKKLNQQTYAPITFCPRAVFVCSFVRFPGLGCNKLRNAVYWKTKQILPMEALTI